MRRYLYMMYLFIIVSNSSSSNRFIPNNISLYRRNSLNYVFVFRFVLVLLQYYMSRAAGVLCLWYDTTYRSRFLLVSFLLLYQLTIYIYKKCHSLFHGDGNDSHVLITINIYLEKNWFTRVTLFRTKFTHSFTLFHAFTPLLCCVFIGFGFGFGFVSNLFCYQYFRYGLRYSFGF